MPRTTGPLDISSVRKNVLFFQDASGFSAHTLYIYISEDRLNIIMAHHAWNPECKVYVGGLKEEANRYDLEDAFSKIGKVVLHTL